MEFDRKRLCEAMKAAGLSTSDLARVMGVSRVTVYNWLNRGEPHALIADRYEATLVAIEKAADNGRLPVGTRGKIERIQDIKQALEFPQ